MALNYHKKLIAQLERQEADLQEVNKLNEEHVNNRDMFSKFLCQNGIIHQNDEMYNTRIYLSPTAYFNFFFGTYNENEYAIIERIENSEHIMKDEVIHSVVELYDCIRKNFLMH